MSAFTTLMPHFDYYLLLAKDDSALVSGGGSPPNGRFIARNFLLEEHLDDSRVRSYSAYLPAGGSVDFAFWDTAHNSYLTDHIFLPPPSGHDYRFIAPDNHRICPETFRGGMALIPFHGTHLNTDFIRVIPVAALAHLSREREDYIYSLGEQFLANQSRSNPAYAELSRILDNAFNGPLCDHRPVFAAFYDEFLDDLRDPRDTSWPNRLRDRLGLYHINQWQAGGLPRKVFLFKYKVRELPRHPRDPSRRPIAIPVVLDHRLSEAFCPAPKGLDSGRVLNLEANAIAESAREVVHLFLPLQVDHLFRVGLVTTPVPDDLSFARRDHLIWMRLRSERESYASDTDADLF